VSGDFFDRLEAELAGLTRQGSHVDGAAAGPDRRRLGALIRRGAAIAGLVVALAASLVGGFPESASGRALTAQAPATRAL
jgi:hypothetical protein